MAELQNNCLDMALLAAEPNEDVFGRLVNVAGDLGFKYCAYGIRAPVPISNPTIGMINNYPVEWQRQYKCQNYIAIDPTVRRALRSSGPIIWTGEVAFEAPGFWEEARSMGLCHGWALAFHDRCGAVSLVTFARDAEPITDQELKEKFADLTWTAHVAHLSMSRRWLPHHVPETRLRITAREREVLRWTAEGKTSYETGQIMNVSERTVNFHISNVVAKLGATNKTQAAVKAAMLGMLF